MFGLFFKLREKKISYNFLYVLFFLLTGTSFLHANSSTSDFKAVIFDCDGVLVDTEYLKFLAWQEALAAKGVPFSIEEYMPLVGHSSENILAMIKKNKEMDLPSDVVENKRACYQRLQKQGVPPIHEMIRFARVLFENKCQLKIKLALASSAPREQIFINLRQSKIEHLFDLIISGSDDLEDYVDPDGKNKPKPYIYLEAAKRLNIAPANCLVFEDTKAGVDAASGAKMTCVAVPNRFTLSHDFSNADHIFTSYDPFQSLDILKYLGKNGSVVNSNTKSKD